MNVNSLFLLVTVMLLNMLHFIISMALLASVLNLCLYKVIGFHSQKCLSSEVTRKCRIVDSGCRFKLTFPH